MASDTSPQDPLQPIIGDLSNDVATPPNADEAASLIREKVARIYANEPSAKEELREAAAEPTRSKHQQFMLNLSNSGKDLATIQTEWHNYYVSLPDDAKHEVWQEFYASNQASPVEIVAAKPTQKAAHDLAEHKHAVLSSDRQKAAAKPRVKARDLRSPKAIQSAIRDNVTAGGKLKVKHHVQSLLFGLGMGVLVLVVFLFSFFNEIIIAPFIQPSRASADTPIIVDANGVAPTATPEVIIPKINVQIPVNFNETSTDEATIENDLESGIVHYPSTVMPGQQGNAAFFGHSSNNIFNPGKYKFAFVLLHTLVPGDTFYITNNSKVYVYKVITKTIVSPNDVSVLGPVAGQTATATLITCDPPGTSLNRLIIVGQQISPDPTGDTVATTTAATSSGTTTTSLPGNGPTLLGRVSRTTGGRVVGIGIIVVAVVCTLRWVNKPRRQLKARGGR
jgi:LPXTG-site transpeptidase (sortase) family protein